MGNKKRRKEKPEDTAVPERKTVNAIKTDSDKPEKFSVDINYSSDFPLEFKE